MVKDILMRLKAKTDVSQGIAARNLAKQQMKQLVVAGQASGMPVAVILDDEFIELITGNEVHNLGEDIATSVHNLAVLNRKITASISNQKIKERSEPLINKRFYIV